MKYWMILHIDHNGFFFNFYFIGSPSVHEKAPLTKSIMLAGPRGTGKKMLVQQHFIYTFFSKTTIPNFI
jgi:predicted AAA+ superfamily ATPase